MKSVSIMFGVFGAFFCFYSIDLQMALSQALEHHPYEKTKLIPLTNLAIHMNEWGAFLTLISCVSMMFSRGNS